MQIDGLAERLQARLARGRAAAEARMLSRVTVRRRSTYSPQDEETGLEGVVWTTTHSDLPCRMDQAGGASAVSGDSNRREIGGAHLELGTTTGQVPHDTADLRVGDLVLVTAGTWPGTVWRIADASVGDQQTARRIRLEETPRPSEWEG
jgi:hypothetical protein